MFINAKGVASFNFQVATISLSFPSPRTFFEFMNLKCHSVNFMQVVKENQVLHKGSRIIDVESACLADLEIFPGDVLWVTDSEIHENRDIAGRNLAVCNFHGMPYEIDDLFAISLCSL